MRVANAVLTGVVRFDIARKCASLRHARTSRGRNRPPWPRTRDGGAAHRWRARRPPRSEAPAAPRFRATPGRADRDGGRAAGQVPDHRSRRRRRSAGPSRHVGTHGRRRERAGCAVVPPPCRPRARHLRAGQPYVRPVRRSEALRNDGPCGPRRAFGPPADRASRAGADRSGIRREPALGVARRKAHTDQGGVARPACRRRTRQHLCLREPVRIRNLAPPPRRQCGAARAGRLARAIRETLASAIDAGGSTLRDHAAPDGELGYFQHRFKVYGREGEPCPDCDCGGAVRRIVQSGRSTFYCAARQR